MTKTFSLPMYDINHATTEALTDALVQLLAARGVAARVAWHSDLLPHWRDHDLLLSQTCGYPLVKLLPDVQLVGAFQSSAPGCEGLRYRSWLVVRAEDAALTLADFRGRRAVCNSDDSHSGYNSLRYVVAPLAQQGRFFAETGFSGSHRQSLAALRHQQADIAAIDCITWALLLHNFPEELAGLTIIGETPLCAALPLITAPSTDQPTLTALRSALTQLVQDEAYRELCATSLIGGFATPDRAFYDEVLQWEQQAATRGVTAL
ncbi:ABC-type phosphate/phosphonate transport system, periplasmic component [Pantoea sp. AS-PWVM4]|uniref:phosphate/phosphite/phosphonate ABC transporter substrate-binding protein n=1 Tax=Pantoea sp. AS-PWVM4 TaxID=1332069 RepID=UPI0003AC6081|nr:PhnD/SsuA/transferrin family substrate-binding protein [Pantoea sp. AS-PWVM4]ERK17744.1 ABC-type phosphate/phosphonate transport system, periplasmic component [Pantoea sp. AS-PWVM4]